MNFRDHLEAALLGDGDGRSGIVPGSWMYAVEDINYDYAGIRPMQHTGSNMDRFINDDVSTFGIIEGYQPAKILEWAVFLKILPPDIKWVLAVSAGDAAEFFAPYYPSHDIGKEVRPVHLMSFGKGFAAGIWKDLFIQRFTSARTPVYFTKALEDSKCQEYINLRVLTAIADDIAIMSGSQWDSLHRWTADQRRRFAEVVTGSSKLPLPEEMTVLEASLAAGFEQISYRYLSDENASKIPGYESCIGAFRIWEECLDQYNRSGYRIHSDYKDPDALIEQAEKFLVTTQAGPMLAALNAGVPVEDVIA